MFCPTCGQPSHGSERFCSNCGTDLTKEQFGVVPSPISGELTPMAVPNVAAQTAADHPAAVRPAPVAPVARPAGEPRGVGGWLLIFLLWICVVDPLMYLRLVPYLRYMSANPMLVVSMLLTAYGVLTGIMLWQLKPGAIVMLRIYFALVALEWVMGIAVYFISYSRMPGVYIWSFLLSWARVAAFLAGWVSYFRVSVRVRNTYGMNV